MRSAPPLSALALGPRPSRDVIDLDADWPAADATRRAIGRRRYVMMNGKRSRKKAQKNDGGFITDEKSEWRRRYVMDMLHRICTYFNILCV